MISEVITALRWLCSWFPYWYTTPGNIINVVHLNYLLPFPSVVYETRLSGFTWDFFLIIEPFPDFEQSIELGNIRETTFDNRTFIFEIQGSYIWTCPKQAVLRFGAAECEETIASKLKIKCKEFIRHCDSLSLDPEELCGQLREYAQEEFGDCVEFYQLDVGGFAEMKPKQFLLEGLS